MDTNDGKTAGAGPAAQGEAARLRGAPGLLRRGQGGAGCVKGRCAGGPGGDRKGAQASRPTAAPPWSDKEDLPVDIEASISLFRSLCRLGEAANPHLAAQMEKIEQALADRRAGPEGPDGRAAAASRRSRAPLPTGDWTSRSSRSWSGAAPGLRSKRRASSFAAKSTWNRRGRPLPRLRFPARPQSSERGRGKRYSLCSRCACQWRVDRLSCSVCGNKEPGALHYFCGEGEEAHRIDLCDACHHYIKTIDCRSLEESDPAWKTSRRFTSIVVAAEKGYERPVPNPWILHRRGAESNSHTEGGSRR